MSETNRNYSDDEEITFEENVRKFGNWLSKNISGIFAILISIFFVFQGLVDIVPTALGIKEQIIMAFTNIVAGFSITSLVGEYGFTSAKNTKVYINQRDSYNDSVKKSLKYREAIEELAKDKAKQNLISARIHILESANLYYGDIFSENGSLKTDFDIMKYRKDKNFYKKLKAYNRAVRLKVINVNVFGMASSSTFGLKKEITEKSYRTRKGAKSLIFKVLLGVSSVGVAFVFNGWSIGALIYAFMQIVLWVGFGLIDRQKNFNFVYDEIIPQMNGREIIINEFMNKEDNEKQEYINRAKQNHITIKQLPYIEKTLQDK